MPAPWRLALRAVLALAMAAAPAAAQLSLLRSAQDTTRARARNDAPEGVDPDSPRAAIRAFQRSARRGDWEAAARWLVLPPEESGRGAELARRLAAVLDRHLEIRLDHLSPRAAGDTADGLPVEREEIGRIPSAEMGTQPVRLVRLESPPPPHWAFSPKTVQNVDAWYDELEDKWLRDRLPDWLFLAGPWQVQWWQWVAVLLFLPLVALLAALLRPVLRAGVHALPIASERTAQEIATTLGTPTLTVIAALLFQLATSSVLVTVAGQRVLGAMVGALVILALTWWALRAVTVTVRLIPDAEFSAGRPGVRSAVQLGGRVTRVFVVMVGLIGLFADFGYPVGTLLAGLGIGGIAVALGAQKTLEHFFGSVSLGLDQPIRVGDWVKIEDFEGEVENIGLRSTRIRTLERTLISLPNGKLAEMRTENFAERDRIRFHALLGVEYGTPPEKLRAVRDAFEQALRAHPNVWPDRVVVRIKEFGSYAIQIEVMAWFLTRDADQFRLWREAMLLRFLELLNQHQVWLAFPTQTVHASPAMTPPPVVVPVVAPAPPATR
ncbi:MAG: mechanosensitive ion channel family protein [Gemmatimonadetes bacterium]|nr:mechanosensitive ion channel family protein [Gemmatimonadota bacterium]